MDKCREWKRSKHGQGYGLKRLNGKRWRVHRWIWTLAHGEIPKGKVICHKCDNPSCYKLSHLFIGTQKENMKDMIKKGRSPKGEDRPNSKLTEDKIKEIKSLLAEGNLTQKEIAKLYSVSRVTITHIKSGNRWKHL